MQQLMNMTQLNEKIKASETVVVKIGAVTCPPCRRLDPIVDDLDNEFSNIPFYKVDADNSPDIIGEFGISSIPVVLIYNKGNCVKTFVGYQDKKTLSDVIKGWA